MLGCTVELKSEDKEFLKNVISVYISTLKESSKPLYEMTLRKLNNQKIFVDGIYMRCMEISLLAHSKTQSGRHQNKCIELAENIRKIREDFQMNAMARLF